MWQQTRQMGRYARRPAKEQRERERLQEMDSTEHIPCNADIQADEVRLIRDGNQHSIVSKADALREAQQQGLDLVQVCRGYMC